MKIQEIIVSEAQLNELDVLGGIASLGKAALKATTAGVVSATSRGYARAKNIVNPDDVTEDDLKDYRPRDGQSEYYKDQHFYYDAKSKKWINSETEKSAWPATQEVLMNKYGFRSSGTPTRELRRKIFQKKKRAAETRAGGKTYSFPKASIQKIQAAFQKSRDEFDSTGRLDSFFRNAEAMLDYTDRGFDITKLQKAVRPSFLVTGATTFISPEAETIFDSTFVTPDKTKLAQALSAYRTSTGSAPGGPPTGFKDIPAAGLNQINQQTVMAIRSLNTTEVAHLPKSIRDLEYKNFKTDDIKQTVISEIDRLLIRSATPGKKLTSSQIGALLDMITLLKPILQPKAADLNTKMAALNFNTLVPDLTDSDELILTQKRDKARIV